MPLSVPVLATLALFEGVAAWNNWTDTVFFTKSPNLATLAAVLIRIIRQLDPGGFDLASKMNMAEADQRSRTMSLEGMRYATMVISIVPVMLIYPFMQKYFVKGIRVGAVKG
jgi:putative aldouronate transport system permease protein